MRDDNPSARRVHAVIAATLANPELLATLRNDPSLLSTYGVAEGTIDLKQLWLFSGLTTKVRQNDIRIALPETFRLLDRLGLSIEIFAAYSSRAMELRNSGEKSKSAKIAAFCEFLEDWLDLRNIFHALIWDIVRHERSLFDLKDSFSPNVRYLPHDVAPVINSRTRPLRLPGLSVHEMRHDPVKLEISLRNGIDDISSLRRRRASYAYYSGGPDVGVRVTKLDELGSATVALSDGKHTLAQIGAILRQAGVTIGTREIVTLVKILFENGLLVSNKP